MCKIVNWIDLLCTSARCLSQSAPRGHQNGKTFKVELIKVSLSLSIWKAYERVEELLHHCTRKNDCIYLEVPHECNASAQCCRINFESILRIANTCSANRNILIKFLRENWYMKTRERSRLNMLRGSNTHQNKSSNSSIQSTVLLLKYHLRIFYWERAEFCLN